MHEETRDQDIHHGQAGDDNATADSGAVYGGSPGTMAAGNERHGAPDPGPTARNLSGAAGSTVRRVPSLPPTSEPADPDPVRSGKATSTADAAKAVFGSGGGAGRQDEQAKGGHPMGQVDAGNTAMGDTDVRAAARDNSVPHQGSTGETAADVEVREHPPVRGGITGTEANDTF